MTRHEDDTSRLGHMLDYARTARRLVEGRARDDLEHDEALRLALIRAVEVIGEAAAQVSQTTQISHPDIPWRQMVGTRNRLIHGYDAVDHDVLWDIVELDLPPLIQRLEDILGAEDEDPA